MTPETLALAREVVTYSGWRWLPGMRLLGKYPDYPVRLCDYGERVFDTMDTDEIEWWQQPGGKDTRDGGPYPGPYLPDLDDPLTALSLLVLVREAFNGPTLHTRPCFGGWYIEREHEDDHEWLHADGAWGEAESRIIWEKTEVAALVAALKAAHERSKP